MSRQPAFLSFSFVTMIRSCTRFLFISLCVIYKINYCGAQIGYIYGFGQTPGPLPFPACKADDIPCLRRGLRTFFFLMESGHMGMQPVDPAQINSVVIALPEQQVSFFLRKINVTGAKWTKLAERRFNLAAGKTGVRFLSDLHITGELTMNMAQNLNPFMAHITMDMQDVESNITYTWTGQRIHNDDDYIIIGPDRVAVRNTRTPSYFLQPDDEESRIIDQVLQARPSILDHMSNEIVIALMHSVMDNFRLFASRVPVKYYYKYEYINN